MPGLASVADGLAGPPEEMSFEVQVFQTQRTT
jgi:hypothetical protein